VRRALGLKPAPEFEAWLQGKGIVSGDERFTLQDALPAVFQKVLHG
jgi:ethanolamine ammonia-lyase large subunit